jgi:phytoene dehydrogenase-like protein
VDLVRRYFVTEELRMVAAPWPLHLGAGPEDPSSALWAVFALGAMAGGNPAPVGGSGRLADALAALVTERGGVVCCDHGAGENSLSQGFTQRPIPAHAGGYHTAVPGVWLIGAATWPGPAVSGASGRAVARALTRTTA